MTGRANPDGDRVAIVVPCYDEADRLRPGAFDAYLRTTTHTDFILVDDGSTDATAAVLDDLRKRWPERVRVQTLPENRGKGEAVRQGMLAALENPDVRYAGYWDADLATPLSAIEDFAEQLDRREELEIVLGARVQLLGRRIERRALRHALGRAFATLASAVLALPVYDTQCGAKLFRASDRIRSLFRMPFGSRWIFDVEILARYLKIPADGSGIYELPLERWTDVGASKVRPIDFVRALGETVRIYRQYRVSETYRPLFDWVTAPFVRYSAAGAIGTTCHYTLLTLAVELFALPAALGAGLGATSGAAVNYFLNYHFTFASERRHREALPRFLSVAAGNVAWSALFVGLAVRYTDLHYLLAQILASLTGLVVGFAINRSWTFRSHG